MIGQPALWGSVASRASRVSSRVFASRCSDRLRSVCAWTGRNADLPSNWTLIGNSVGRKRVPNNDCGCIPTEQTQSMVDGRWSTIGTSIDGRPSAILPKSPKTIDKPSMDHRPDYAQCHTQNAYYSKSVSGSLSKHCTSIHPSRQLELVAETSWRSGATTGTVQYSHEVCGHPEGVVDALWNRTNV